MRWGGHSADASAQRLAEGLADHWVLQLAVRSDHLTAPPTAETSEHHLAESSVSYLAVRWGGYSADASAQRLAEGLADHWVLQLAVRSDHLTAPLTAPLTADTSEHHLAESSVSYLAVRWGGHSADASAQRLAEGLADHWVLQLAVRSDHLTAPPTAETSEHHLAESSATWQCAGAGTCRRVGSALG